MYKLIRTGIILPKKTYERLSQAAKDEGTSVQKIIEDLIDYYYSGDVYGYRITEGREARALSRVELSYKADISLPRLARLEMAIEKPTWSELDKLSRSLNFPERFFTTPNPPQRGVESRNMRLHFDMETETEKCAMCNSKSKYLCDVCDIPMCGRCAVDLGYDTHVCEEHNNLFSRHAAQDRRKYHEH